MRFGVIASVLFHLAIVGMAFITLPSAWRPNVTPEPFIPLDLIREADLALKTSVPAARPDPKPVEEIKPDLPDPVIEETPPAPVEEKKPDPVTQPEPEKAPEVKKPDPEPVKPEVKPEVKKPDPPKETPAVKPKPKNDELDFDALSQLIDKEKKNEQSKNSQAPSETVETADRARAAVGAGDRLAASDEAKLKAAMAECWNASAIIGAPEPEKLLVVIEFELNRNGTLASPPRVVNELQINLSGNQFWRVAQREALSAVNKCAPYDFLPVERYDSWKAFRFNFDPSQMVGF